MPVSKFCLSTARKKVLGELLSRTKPRLPDARIKFFLAECEREIKIRLSYYPAGWTVDELTTKRLETAGKAAQALNVALRALNDGERLALFAGVLVGHESGVDIREAIAEAREAENLINKICQESQHLSRGPGTPVKERLAEEIAYAIAISYVVAFESLPSLRHDSAYKLFVDDITANDLSDEFRVSIGKRKMDLANRRAAVHLELIQLNRTVSTPME